MAKRITSFYILYVFAISICLIPIKVFAKSSSFIVITHPSTQVDSISKQELRDIYNGDRIFWMSGKRIRAARLPDDSDITVDFLKTVMDKSASQYLQHWRHKLFSGKGLPPKVIEDSDKMISYVEGTESAIGFLPAGTKLNSTKIKILEIPE